MSPKTRACFGAGPVVLVAMSGTKERPHLAVEAWWTTPLSKPFGPPGVVGGVGTKRGDV